MDYVPLCGPDDLGVCGVDVAGGAYVAAGGVGFAVGRFRVMVAIGALAGLCSMGFHGFFDFNFQIPANQVFFVLLMALVESGLWPDKR